MRNILVIEDEEQVKDSIRDILELEGYSVVTSEDGKTAKKLLNEVEFDLVLCDINMPEMNGFEFLKYLRSIEKYSTVPFIFLTAKVEKEDMRHGMELGADDYLFKPFKTKELINAVKTRLDLFDKSNEITENKLNNLRIQLSSTLPHEFRTPLNVILATSQFLDKKMELMSKNEIQEMVSNIVSAGNRLNKLISNYLIYTNLMLNQDNLDFKDKVFTNYTRDPKDILASSFYIVANENERLEDLDLDSVSVELNIFPEYFLKVTDELASNAFKFSEDGTQVKVKGILENGRYLLTVEDKGVGFEPEKLKEIGGFNQFGRKEFEQQGMGLGLAIIKLISEKFDLEFDIDTKLNEYTKISISFPINKNVSESE